MLEDTEGALGKKEEAGTEKMEETTEEKNEDTEEPSKTKEKSSKRHKEKKGRGFYAIFYDIVFFEVNNVLMKL